MTARVCGVETSTCYLFWLLSVYYSFLPTILKFRRLSTQTAYFESQGHPLPPKFNPADWMLDLVSLDYRSPSALETSRQRIDALTSAHSSQQVDLQVGCVVTIICDITLALFLS